VKAALTEFVRTIRKSSAASVGLVLILIVVALAILAPVIAPYDPLEADFLARAKPPSFDHWLGTDHLGRDILSRLLYGARLSLVLGIGSVLIGASTGITTGLIVGYAGGVLDSLVSRIVDILFSFRLLLLAITVMAVLGPSLTNTMIAIGISLFATFTRLARGEVLSAKHLDHIEATRAVGASTPRLLFRHILPNIMGPLIVFSTLRLGVAILSESALSFLGLGPPPPTPAWGMMVNEGLNQLRSAWWVSTIPGIAITIVVLAFNLLGDGLRDALDPRLRRLKN
jgi:peptide/nickel transport system permease protein